MIKYFHLRYRWADLASDMNPDGTGGQGGVTIGMRNGHADPNVVEFAYAICNLQDNFCRRTGRNIVNGRFASEDFYRHEFTPNQRNSIWDEVDKINEIIDIVKSKAIEKITEDLHEAELYWEALN